MSNIPLFFIHIFAFIFGALWGSFLNVVIYRLPRKESLIYPASHCPHCHIPIKAYDNIPILSWLLLRGQCRHCGAKISIQYPLIELSMALLSYALSCKIFDPYLSPELSIAILLVPFSLLFIYMALLLALLVIDLQRTELPPVLSFLGMGIGILYHILTSKSPPLNQLTPNFSWIHALLGAVLGMLIIFFIILIYFFLSGKIGMGGGDAWLMGMVGALLGWPGLYFVILASSFQGVLIAVVIFVWSSQKGKDLGFFRNEIADQLNQGVRDQEGEREFGQYALPYGPFIVLATLEYLFWGDRIMPWLTSGLITPNGVGF